MCVESNEKNFFFVWSSFEHFWSTLDSSALFWRSQRDSRMLEKPLKYKNEREFVGGQKASLRDETKWTWPAWNSPHCTDVEWAYKMWRQAATTMRRRVTTRHIAHTTLETRRKEMENMNMKCLQNRRSGPNEELEFLLSCNVCTHTRHEQPIKDRPKPQHKKFYLWWENI